MIFWCCETKDNLKFAPFFVVRLKTCWQMLRALLRSGILNRYLHWQFSPYMDQHFCRVFVDQGGMLLPFILYKVGQVSVVIKPKSNCVSFFLKTTVSKQIFYAYKKITHLRPTFYFSTYNIAINEFSLLMVAYGMNHFKMIFFILALQTSFWFVL